jgi:hypothetical protein
MTTHTRFLSHPVSRVHVLHMVHGRDERSKDVYQSEGVALRRTAIIEEHSFVGCAGTSARMRKGALHEQVRGADQSGRAPVSAYAGRQLLRRRPRLPAGPKTSVKRQLTPNQAVTQGAIGRYRVPSLNDGLQPAKEDFGATDRPE